MGYLDNKGLERYTWNVRNRMSKNVQMTKVAPIVQFCPASESDLEPIVNFGFTEILPAEGTKGPDNPSTITGIDSIQLHRSGKNLLSVDDVVCIPDRGITHQVNEDGSVSISGTTVGNGILQFRPGGTTTINTLKNSPFIPGMTYTVSMECPDSNVYGYVHYSTDGGSNWLGAVTAFKGGQIRTFTIPENATSLQIWTQVTDGITVETTVKMQCELGLTATAFEKGHRQTTSVSLNDTYYGGTINLATGLMTVTWEGDTFTQCNNRWDNFNGLTQTNDTVSFQVNAERNHALNYNIVSNMFTIGDSNYGMNQFTHRGANTVSTFKCSMAKSALDLSNVSDPNNLTAEETYAAVNAFLSSNPLFIAYELTTPFTVQLTPQQIRSLFQSNPYIPQINTVYTDQESVQVGWIREDFIHKTGNETIEGIKTFSNATPGSTAGDSVTDLTIRNPAVVRGVRGEGANWTRMIFADKEGNTEGNFAGRLGIFEIRSPKENDTLGEQFRFRCYKYSDNASDYGKATDIILGYDKDGIAYATAPEISEARTNSNDIVTRGHVNSIKSGLESTIEEKTWNWQKTEKNEVVSFNPVPESTLEPVVDFLFTETLPVEGEKSPANPSSITGVNEVLVGRCGKNLFNVFETPMFSNQCSEPDSDGFLTISYTNPNSSGVAHPGFYQQPSKAIKADKTYTVVIEVAEIDGCPISFSMNSDFAQRGQLNTGISSYKDITTVGTHFITCTNNNVYNPNCFLRCMGNVSAGTTGTIKFRISVFEGIVDSSNFEYAPYSGNNYTINLGNTYYGGEIDLATGIMTVTWTCITHFYVNQVTEGTDHYQFRCYDSSSPNHAGNETAVVCSHGLTCISTGYDSKQWYVRIPKSNLDLSSATNPSSPTENELKSIGTAWLTNNNVKIVYKISDIITVQLDPVQIRSLSALDKYEPRVNTIYTDATSVQVGYQRFADEATIVYQNQRIPEEEIDEAFAE